MRINQLGQLGDALSRIASRGFARPGANREGQYEEQSYRALVQGQAWGGFMKCMAWIL